MRKWGSASELGGDWGTLGIFWEIGTPQSLPLKCEALTPSEGLAKKTLEPPFQLEHFYPQSFLPRASLKARPSDPTHFRPGSPLHFHPCSHWNVPSRFQAGTPLRQWGTQGQIPGTALHLLPFGPPCHGWPSSRLACPASRTSGRGTVYSRKYVSTSPGTYCHRQTSPESVS